MGGIQLRQRHGSHHPDGFNAHLLANGAHTLRVYGNDTNGKICASNQVTFTINGKKPPVVTIDANAMVEARKYLPSDFENKTWWKLICHVNEPTSWMGYSLDGGAVEGGGNSTLVLSYGSHTVTVYAKDICGNEGSSAPYTFVLGPGEAGSAYAPATGKLPPMLLPTSTSTLGQTQQQPFPTLLFIAAVLATAFAGVGIIVYFRKHKQLADKDCAPKASG
jgi:hypothetical protein